MGKRMTREQQAEAARIVNEIRADLRELRELFERLQDRMRQSEPA
jgi:hypothetical protein